MVFTQYLLARADTIHGLRDAMVHPGRCELWAKRISLAEVNLECPSMGTEQLEMKYNRLLTLLELIEIAREQQLYLLETLN
jgi:hypothetical protein